MRSEVRGVHLLDGGTLTVESSVVMPGRDHGCLLTVPVQAYLVDTSSGFVLVDTGNDPSVVSDPVQTWGEHLARSSRPSMRRRHRLSEQLSLLGLSERDVYTVIYTHLHHDHAGGGRFLTGASHVVQRSEYRWAREPDPAFSGAYVGNDLSGHRDWRLLDGDTVLSPGVHVVMTPGHTPGHQSVVLWDVPDIGTVILAGDAVSSLGQLELGVGPGLSTNALEAAQSVRRLVTLAEATQGWLVPSHDPGFFASVPKAPRRLERPRPTHGPRV